MVVRSDPNDKGRTHIQLPTPSGSDDSTVWQEQIDAAPAGAVLVAKPASYKMGDIITVSTDRTVLDGYGSTIQATATHDTHLVRISDADDVVIRGFTIDGNRTATTNQDATTDQAIVHVDANTGGGISRFRLLDLHLINGHQSGVFVETSDIDLVPLNGTIQRVTVERMGHRGIRILRGHHVNVLNCDVYDVDNVGIYQEQSKGGSVVGCTIDTTGNHGIAVAGSDTKECVDVLVDGNQVYRSARSGITCGPNARRFRFVNNRVHNCVHHGISVDVQLITGDWTVVPVNAVVEGNQCDANLLYGIHVRVFTDMSIKGNHCWQNEVGIFVQNARYATITGNNLFSNTTWGLSFSQGVSPDFVASGYHEIFGNSIHGNGTGDLNTTAAAALTYDCYLGDKTVIT